MTNSTSRAVANDLTERQQEILDYMKDFFCENQGFPTIREIGLEFGIRSPNGVMTHLKALRRKGYLEFDPRAARGTRLVGYRAKLEPTNGRRK